MQILVYVTKLTTHTRPKKQKTEKQKTKKQIGNKKNRLGLARQGREEELLDLLGVCA